MILGPPRSGKTSSLIIPNVLAANGPVVSTSTKPDVLDATVAARSALGRCHLFDPSGSVRRTGELVPLRWSPLQSCRTWPGALSMARSLVEVGSAINRQDGHQGGGSHWTERAQALLAPLLHAAALDGADMRTLLTWVDRHQALPAQQILAGAPGRTTELARNLLDGIAATDARELSGIWSTASGSLAGFRSDQALEATAEPTFDPPRFVAVGGHHLHRGVGPPPGRGGPDGGRPARGRPAGRLRPPRVGGRRGRDRRTSPPLLLALDEVANIAPLPDLPAMVSEGGGQGVVTLACLQDLSQARQRWPGRAEGFASLFGTTVVLPGIGDVATLEALSTLAGDEELVVRTVSAGQAATDRPFTDLVTGGRPHRGESVTTQWRRRLPPDVITRGVAGHLLAFDERNQPGWVPLAPSYATEPWRTLREPGSRPGTRSRPGRRTVHRAGRGHRALNRGRAGRRAGTGHRSRPRERAAGPGRSIRRSRPGRSPSSRSPARPGRGGRGRAPALRPTAERAAHAPPCGAGRRDCHRPAGADTGGAGTIPAGCRRPDPPSWAAQASISRARRVLDGPPHRATGCGGGHGGHHGLATDRAVVPGQPDELVGQALGVDHRLADPGGGHRRPG